MKEVDIKKLLFRASSMGGIMTGKEGITETQLATLAKLDEKISIGKELTKLQAESYKKLIHKRDNPSLSLTTKRKAISTIRAARTGRHKQINTKQINNGKDAEQDSITNYSIFKGKMYYRRRERLNDTHFTGEIDVPDVDKNVSIMKAKKIIDVKSVWEVDNMPTVLDDLETTYFYQMQTYMALIPNADEAVVAKILTNHTAKSIMHRIYQIGMKYDDLYIMSEEALKEVKQLELDSIFDREMFKSLPENKHYDFYVSEEEWIENEYDIPLEERIFEFNLVRDDNAIQTMRDRVEECRQWLIENHKHL